MEDEIRKLIDAIKGLTGRDQRVNTISANLANKTEKERKKLLDGLKKELKAREDLNKLSEKEKNNLKGLNEELELAKDEVESFGKNVSLAGAALGSFIKTSMKLGDAQAKADSDFQTVAGFVSGFGVTGSIIDNLSQSLDYNLQTFRELTQVGATFGKSLIELRQIAQSARLPLGEFAGLVADNSVALSALFGTTEQGARAIGGFSKAIRDKALTDGLFGLGVTTEELNEYLGTYLERQRLADTREIMTEQNVLASTIAYTKQLDILSKVTGQQRQLINETIKDQQSDAILQRALTGLTEEQKIQANQFLAVLKNVNPELANNAKVLMETGAPLNEFGDLLVGTNPQLGGILTNFKDLLREGKSVPEILGMISATSKDFNQSFGQAELAFGSLAEVGDTNMQLAALNIAAAKAAEEQQKQQSALNALLTPFNEEMRKLKTAFANVQTEFLSKITPAISGVTDFLKTDFTNVVSGIGNFLTDFPKTSAALFVAGLGGTMLFDFAKQVLIVKLGVQAALGTGMGMMGKLGMGGLKAAGGAALAAGGVAVAESAESNIGKGAGILTAAGGGALTGAQFGAFLGPKGALIGSIIGGLLAGGTAAYKGFFDGDERALGTMGATGQRFEPQTSLLKIHAGERVLNPSETANYNQNEQQESQQMTTALNNLNNAMQEVAKQLNTGNMIAGMIEKNTNTTTKRLANMGGVLV